MASLYYTLIISYGNMFAFNGYERLYAVFIMVLGGMIMTYGISVVSQIFVSMDIKNHRFDAHMQVLDRIHRDYRLPLDLYLKLRKQLHYKFIDKDV